MHPKRTAQFFILLLLLGACKKLEKFQDCRASAIPSCVCTAVYDPVCGCDNVTYGNSCEATCSGIKNWTSGKCK